MSSSSSAPWQFHWKKPIWKKLIECKDLKKDSNNKNKKGQHSNQGIPIAHTAAAILPTEFPLLLEEEEESTVGGVITVTLLCQQSTDHSDYEENFINVADIVHIQVLDGTGSTIKQSRILRWPRVSSSTGTSKRNLDTSSSSSTTSCFTPFGAGSSGGSSNVNRSNHNNAFQAVEEMAENDNDDDDNNNYPCSIKALDNNPLLALLPRQRNKNISPRRNISTKEESYHNRPSSGLISAALVRLPRTTDIMSNKNNNSKQQRGNMNNVADAQDVLQHLAMSAGSPPSMTISQYNTNDNNQQQHDVCRKSIRSRSSSTMTTSDSTLELLLACLSTEGKVHFYSPWKLLEKKGEINDTVLEEGMASFLFGNSLLGTVKNTIRPLSQPDKTINLSLPFLQRGGYHTRHKSLSVVKSNSSRRSEHVDESATITVSSVHNNNNNNNNNTTSMMQQQQHAAFFSVFDGARWDPTIENATLVYQTKDNQLTHCIYALEYLCIAGYGRSRWADNNNNIEQHFFGGFVTFLSLQTFSEKRTLFLPFIPKSITPFRWGVMTFLLVIGERGIKTMAVAIRIDSNKLIRTVKAGTSPLTIEQSKTTQNESEQQKQQHFLPTTTGRNDDNDDNNHEKNKKQSKKTVPIRRFQILPIDLPIISAAAAARACCAITGSELSTVPPTIAVLVLENNSHDIELSQLVMQSINIAEDDKFPIFAEYHYSMTSNYINSPMAYIATVKEEDKTARIRRTEDVKNTQLWCHLGQGWSLFGGPDISTHFACLEGSNLERGAFLHDFTDVENKVNESSIPSLVLPVDPFDIPLPSIYSNVDFPFSNKVDNNRSNRMESDRGQSFESSAELDEIVVQAMESISFLQFRDSLAKESSLSPRRKSVSFSAREKSERLLRHCSSWTKLERLGESKEEFDEQTPVVSVRTMKNSLYGLSLRKASVQNGPAAPFEQILAWLSEQQDYFTAASLALDLLRDVESLRHLWKAFDKIDDEDARSQLDGLLDGIIPIRAITDDSSADEVIAYKTTVTQLADMTVGCLTKGGYEMSSTLEHFLGKDCNYDPSRASLMLVATAASALSDDEDLVASVMGIDCAEDRPVSTLLWPVKCLLQIGVARDHLMTVLLLLNTTIPDEMRRRNRGGMASTSIPSMEMCKSLVSLIVDSAPEAAEIMLDLVDEKTRLRFWESLEDSTRLELSLISVNTKHPLLCDPEVRTWALLELQKSTKSSTAVSSAKESGVLPPWWLSALVWACLKNAGCDTKFLTNDKDGEVFTSDNEEDDDDGLEQHIKDVKEIRNAFLPDNGSGWIDFDLVIPALLILEHRNLSWNEKSKTSTRSLLNAACYLAGRLTDEPRFPLNSSTLMRQCTLMGDVEAGANLIGGKNGLCLECSHILVEEINMNMDEAEDYLLRTFDDDSTSEAEGSRSFSIQPGHRRILWLLEEHTLRIRTYGEFETSQTRGRVDPVFAATLCFRTWWKISQNCVSDASKWLVRWLRRQLSISESLTSTSEIRTSPHRLACAALARALIWSEDGTVALANKLKIESLFLVQLCQSCCGLVEALPGYVADEKFQALVESKNSPSRRIFPVQRDSVHDESFLTASGSFDDLPTHFPWLDASS